MRHLARASGQVNLDEHLLVDSAARLNALVEKLERDGYPCEIRAARRALNSLNQRRAAHAHRVAQQPGTDAPG